MTVSGQSGGVEAGPLRAFTQRVERLREEIADLNADVSEVYKEAKAFGYEIHYMKAAISKRAKLAKNPDKFEETEEMVGVYLRAMDGDDEAPRVHVHEGHAEQPQITDISPSGDTTSCGRISSLPDGQGDSEGPKRNPLSEGPQETTSDIWVCARGWTHAGGPRDQAELDALYDRAYAAFRPDFTDLWEGEPKGIHATEITYFRKGWSAAHDEHLAAQRVRRAAE